MVLIDVWLCSRLVKVLLGKKKKNAKRTTKCSQYNMTLTMVDEFQ